MGLNKFKNYKQADYLFLSVLGDNVEMSIVLVLPGWWCAKIGVVEELAATLGPPDWFHFSVSPKQSWI